MSASPAAPSIRPPVSAAPPAPSVQGTAAGRRVRRILIVEANDDGTVGGSHQALYDHAIHLDRTRYEPVVLFYQENRYSPLLRAAGVPVHQWDDVWAGERSVLKGPSRWRKLPALVAAVRRRVRFMREQHIDLLHLNNSPRIGADDWMPAARLAGIPVIANGMGAVTGDTGVVRTRLVGGFDHILPCSDMVAEGARQIGYAAEQVTTVHLGVDLEAFRARVGRDPAAVRAAIGVGAGQRLAIMIGNVRHWKGQHVVLAALERMRPELRARLVVAFAGAARPDDAGYMQSLEDTVTRAALGDSVRFLGVRDDIPDLVNAADATIHASVTPEPFGLVVIEGMALGKLVLAARAGGPVEIFADGSGALHDPAHPEELAAALERLVTDDAWVREMGARALRRVDEFSVRRTVAKIEGVYRRYLD